MTDSSVEISKIDKFFNFIKEFHIEEIKSLTDEDIKFVNEFVDSNEIILDEFENNLEIISKFLNLTISIRKLDNNLFYSIFDNIVELFDNIIGDSIDINLEHIKILINFYIENYEDISDKMLHKIFIFSQTSNNNIELDSFEFVISRCLEINKIDSLVCNLEILFDYAKDWEYDVLFEYIQIIEKYDKTLLFDLDNDILDILKLSKGNIKTIIKIIDFYFENKEYLLNQNIKIDIFIDKILYCLFEIQNPIILEFFVRKYAKLFYFDLKINIFEKILEYLNNKDLNKFNGYFKFSIKNYYGIIFNQMYNKVGKILKSEIKELCSICLEDSDELFITICNHKFCNSCIKKNIIHNLFNSTGYSCPYCRKNYGKILLLTEIRIRDNYPFLDLLKIIRKNFDIGRTIFRKNNKYNFELYSNSSNYFITYKEYF